MTARNSRPKQSSPRRQEPVRIDPKSTCVHCRKALFKGTKHQPKVRLETNGVGEAIAWCICGRCNKPSPVFLSSLHAI